MSSKCMSLFLCISIQIDMALTALCRAVCLLLCKNRSIGPELTTAKTGPIHLSSLVEIAFVD